MVSKREEYEAACGKDFTEQKVNKIISRAGLLMVGVVMFFAFSCLFALSPANMAEAKEMNIPVLTYRLTTSITWAALTVLWQLSRSGLHQSSHWLQSSNPSSVTTGTLEGMNGLLLKFAFGGDKTKSALVN